jgi:RNA polymerase sigma-B factor
MMHAPSPMTPGAPAPPEVAIAPERTTPPVPERTTSARSPGASDAAEVELSLPATDRHLHLARLAAWDLSRHPGFSFEDSQDLKLAVGEALAHLVALSPRDAHVGLRFTLQQRSLTVRGSCPADRSAVEEPDALRRAVLAATLDYSSFSQDGDVNTFVLRKRLPTPPTRRSSVRADDDLAMFVEYQQTGDRALRNRLVEHHLHLVEPHVRRFDGRGVARDDLRQVALLAILRAVERFDPHRGVSFSTFASRTIAGELKRQMRDQSWAVRPPRGHQEVFLAARKAEDDLIQMLGRSPTVKELARATGNSEDLVLEALEAGGARHAGSLDQPTRAGGPSLKTLVGAPDDRFNQAETRLLVGQLLENLDPRDREIIELRFFENMGQLEIATKLDLSQSYVSRLIRRILVAMREELQNATSATAGADEGR